jgi:hypothetical protein
MKELEIEHRHIAQSSALGMDINEYMDYLSLRIKKMQKQNLELNDKIHKLSLNILIKDPIFDKPIKL